MLVDPISVAWQAMHGTPLPASLEPLRRKQYERETDGSEVVRERVYQRRHQANPRGARSRRAPDPQSVEQSRTYMREYQRRRRAALAAGSQVPPSVELAGTGP